MPDLTLSILEGTYAVHRFPPEAAVPAPVLTAPFFAIVRTASELSVVAPQSVRLPGARVEPDWACLKVEAVLEFELTGILAGLAGALANAGVAVFALSTFDTDYLLVKHARLPDAVSALQAAGYHVAR